MKLLGGAIVAAFGFVGWALLNVLGYVFAAIALFRDYPASAERFSWPLAGLFLLFFIASYSLMLNFVLKKASR